MKSHFKWETGKTVVVAWTQSVKCDDIYLCWQVVEWATHTMSHNHKNGGARLPQNITIT